ncbi:MarR family winged helix-turn-helix transcriptional regulator [Clostridium felsineum]|uniref:MarR family winged helix-turn-helix transcriptional regulator n=1 Tax=Clostridium felsineum TaxID=36839 RepID=UPI00098CBEE4|nr:MarR family transcriptional regulator [Clostridium felsineum]URZ16588.1 Multiple antibiotic resistance protein MarR [Clostridium felsineum DSM 794]
MNDFDNSLGYLLNIAAAINKNALFSVLAPYEITPEQFTLLTKIYTSSNGKTQRQLANETYKDEANTTRILKKLELKGYVEKLPGTKDKRNNFVFITEKGMELIKILKPLVTDYRKSILKNLSEEEIKNMKAILKKLIEN